MADNYLEKRMADYVSGRGAAPTTRRRIGYASVKFARQSILLHHADCEAGEALLTYFSQAGITVSFTAADERSGRLAAQRCGGRFLPMPLPEAICETAGEGQLDTLVLFAPGAPAGDARRRLYILPPGSQPPCDAQSNCIITGDYAQAAMFAAAFCNAACTATGCRLNI